ncbi:unnamed protein product [Dibothriocephalus latus]|uniref:F-box domain-containing protein n=1 Tax=Dibothriocephalus latus TaxID=60516 RepID=A0A3P7P425_DIBLA|nr:unnamed protein product [Dibothriocephalus latus]
MDRFSSCSFENSFLNQTKSTSTPQPHRHDHSDTGYESLSVISEKSARATAEGSFSAYGSSCLNSPLTTSSKWMRGPPGRYVGRRFLDIIGEIFVYDKSGMLLRSILKFLDVRSLKMMRLTSKLWRKIVSSYLAGQGSVKRPALSNEMVLDKENTQCQTPGKEFVTPRGVLSSRQPHEGNNLLREILVPSNQLNPVVTDCWKVAETCVGREVVKRCPVCSGFAIRREGTWPDQLTCQQEGCRAVVCAACFQKHSPSADCPPSVLRNPSTGRVEISSETVTPLPRAAVRASQRLRNLKTPKNNRALLRRL